MISSASDGLTTSFEISFDEDVVELLRSGVVAMTRRRSPHRGCLRILHRKVQPAESRPSLAAAAGIVEARRRRAPLSDEPHASRTEPAPTAAAAPIEYLRKSRLECRREPIPIVWIPLQAEARRRSHSNEWTGEIVRSSASTEVPASGEDTVKAKVPSAASVGHAFPPVLVTLLLAC